MAKVIVKDDNLNDAMKKFTRIMSETRKVARNHEYYLRPGLKAKEKAKNAARYNKRKYR
ncbi:MAG: 30S ribosomal protein S21 [Malacoplasma sp.]|nr:30S ribosomal protein S21 [Mycoplasmataceae bacterium]MDD7686213.1 30S ribosomal protein S21 [Mycoplasmataceae bacterium]MDY2887657.1 30S ribosomal protein S21 [Malacoplasma sp.]